MVRRAGIPANAGAPADSESQRPKPGYARFPPMLRFPAAAALLLLASPVRAEEHWAYIPPAAPAIPADSTGNPIDELLEKAWKDAGLQPAEMAAPRLWLERAAYTLTGLPPSADQLRRIGEMSDDATWKSLVDELLASPAYGERWARHWMDVARYADTQGYNFDQDNRYPFAYTYRNWLIDSFNADLPYPDFIKLQVAADSLTDKADDPSLAALGFLTVGPRGGALETIDDRVDVVTRGFLSTTVSCARCHDHKFDPIPTKDYYSLYSIFENTDEPEDKPVIGQPPDATAFEEYKAAAAILDGQDLAARQEIVDQVRTPASSGVYLELAWQAHQENWDVSKATGEAFKRGRYRPNAVIRWRDFLNEKGWGANPLPRLAGWAREMESADAAGKAALCLKLADDFHNSPELAEVSADGGCPLSYDTIRIKEFFDQEDGNQNRKRAGEMTKLQNDHPGSPPRAMSLTDRENRPKAQVYRRGNPADRGEAFEPNWLTFLGGGEFPKDKSPRLALAEKLADPANPLTARVMANRVWGWNFGANLADPGDFGMQTPEPALHELLDWLALRLSESGGSVKDLQRVMLTSKAFRRAADGPAANRKLDEANALFWKWNRRRADFEPMRDRILATAGALDLTSTGGRSFSFDDPASDKRRTVYAFVDRYALANTFVSFDLPHPDHHAAKRVETMVPQQALYYLNGPMVLREAAKLAAENDFLSIAGDREKLAWLYRRIYQREPSAAESADALDWLAHIDPADYRPRLGGVWEIRHAPDTGGTPGEAEVFPMFEDGVWKTGKDLATSPIHWIHAGATGGHPGAGHDLILRWRATGAGEVRMLGKIERTNKGGDTLVWNGPGDPTDHLLPPESAAEIEGKWTKVAAGDTVDFVLRAPAGDSCGAVGWDLRILGRETPDAKPEVISKLADDFPKSNDEPSAPAASDPWADLIQMLWASNEFNFID